MPLQVPVSKGKMVEIDDGTWPAIIVRVDEKTLEDDKFGNPHKALLICQFPDFVDEDTGEFVELDAMANFVMNEKSKLTRWLIAAGVHVDLSGASVDIEAACEREILAVVKHKVKPDGSRGWPFIDDLLPPLGKRAGAAPQPAQPVSVIKSDGSCDFTVFWTEAKKLGFPDKAAVANFRGPDATPPINQLDGIDAQELLEAMKGAKVDPDDLPFE